MQAVTSIPSDHDRPAEVPASETPSARFERLLREHRGIVLKIAYTYGPSQDDRDDLVQDISAELWRSFSRYDPARRFSTWMYRVALNVAISHGRRSRSRFWSRSGTALSIHDASIAIAAAVPEEADPRLAALHQFIRRLNALDRALLLLYLDERSYAEIADVLGITETNVATKISRLKQLIRRDMTVAD